MTASVGPEISVLLDGAQVATSPCPSWSGQLYGRIGARRRQSMADWGHVSFCSLVA
jgi:hypothetical protein